MTTDREKNDAYAERKGKGQAREDQIPRKNITKTRQDLDGETERRKRPKEREGATDMYFYIKCPDVTSSEGVRPRGSTLINKVTWR